MSDKTTYLVETVYEVKDKSASSVLNDIAKNAKAAHTETAGLKSMMLGFGAAVVGHGALREAKKLFIDFNAQVESAKIGLSTIIGANYGVNWDRATSASNRMYNEFQQFSQLLPVTTQELFQFSVGVDQAVAGAGGGIKDMINISEQGVVAAKALGVEAGYAASELSHMLSGNVNNRMMFAKNLVGMLHMSTEEWRKLSAEQRLTLTKKVLNSDTMKDATKAFSQSFAGVTSTLEDKLQILGGKVGLPLFKAITKEVQSWSQWIDAHQGAVDRWAHSVGDALTTGFQAVKTGVTFLVDHAGLLIKVAEAWAAVKIGGALGITGRGMLGGLAGGASSLFGSSGTTRGFFAKGGDQFGPNGYETIAPGRGRTNVSMSNIGGNLPLIGQSLAAGLAIGSALNEVTGISHSTAEQLGLLTGKIDATTIKNAQLVEAMTRFENKVEDTTATMASANNGMINGALAFRTTMVGQLREISHAFGMHDARTNTGLGGPQASWKSLRKAGMDDDDIHKYDWMQVMGGSGMAQGFFKGKADQLEARSNSAMVMAMGLINANMATMTDKEKESVDLQKMQISIYERIFSGEHLGLDIRKLLLGTDPDASLKSQAKTNTTINVNIQQVSAKDPDRWLADMEDYAAKRVAARTRSKNSKARGL